MRLARNTDAAVLVYRSDLSIAGHSAGVLIHFRIAGKFHLANDELIKSIRFTVYLKIREKPVDLRLAGIQSAYGSVYEIARFAMSVIKIDCQIDRIMEEISKVRALIEE